MPHIIRGNSGHGRRKETGSLSNYDYDYSNYPDGGKLKLKPGTKTHDDLVDNILELADIAHYAYSTQHDRWNELDNVLTAYIPLDDAEKVIKDEDSRVPTSVVLPYSFAILDSLLTYLFISMVQDPILQYEGNGPEDRAGALILQSVIAAQTRKFKLPLSLHTLFRDAIVYNNAYGVVDWSTKKGWKRRLSEGDMSAGGEVFGASRERVKTTLFEGNMLTNINPYLALPDPNVTCENAKNGEFFGWIEHDDYMSLLNDESGDSTLFNVRYLQHLTDSMTSIATNKARSVNEDVKKQYNDTNLVRPFDIVSMFVNLIPSEWDMGDSDYPETWFFRVAADSVIIQADRLDYDHGTFPLVSCSPDFDGRSTKSVSRIEVLYSLQSVGDWLFNSHIANVRKSINNMIVVDPHLINLNDLRDREPGKLIRLRRPAWGRGVENSIKQLKVDDITRGNISDAAVLQQVMQMIAGTDGSMMGVQRQGGPERLTGAEFEGTRRSAMSRLERLSKIVSVQALQDISYMFASNTLQFISDEGYVRVVGDYDKDVAERLGMERGRVKADFANMAVDYDVIVRDGTVPGGDFNSGWLEVFKTIMSTPEIGQQFDVMRIFLHIAEGLGARNVSQFKRQLEDVQVTQQPDADVATQAAAGNLVPLQQVTG